MMMPTTSEEPHASAPSIGMQPHIQRQPLQLRRQQQEHQRPRHESLKELIAQKREVSYVQLSLSLKRAQIRKLEAFAARRAAALQHAEETLEADTLQFDEFLRRNDEEVQEAVRQADEQARARQDKVSAPRLLFLDAPTLTFALDSRPETEQIGPESK